MKGGIPLYVGYQAVTISSGQKGEFLFPSLRMVRLVSGSCRWQIGTQTVMLYNGDIVLLNNLTPRSIQESRDLKLDIFEFFPAQLQGYPSLLGAFYAKVPVTIPRETAPLIDNTLNLLSQALKAQPDSAFTKQLATATACLMESHAASLGCTQPSGIAFQAAGYIWEHYSEDLNVPDVAAQVHISKNHLETVFKRIHGVGVGAYIRLIRLYRVQQILTAEPDRSVLDIAFSCGFKSSAGFYKTYKAVYGSSPRRQKLRPPA